MHTRTFRWGYAALALLAGSVLPSCGGSGAEVARLIVTSDAAGSESESVRIIVSSRFIAGPDEIGNIRLLMFATDTIVLQLPVDQSFPMTPDNRIYLEVGWAGADVSQVRMRVEVDGREEFDEQGPILPTAKLRFAYAFNNRLFEPLDVVF